MMSFVFINHIGADGVTYLGFFDSLRVGGGSIPGPKQ